MEEESNLNETIRQVLQILLRRRWWVLATGGFVALATIAVLLFLPNRYMSEATLLVVQQQVPERYVVPNSTTDLTAALQAMKREVLSRPRLRKIVEDFNLYEKRRKRVAPEVITDLMLKDIDIQPLDENPARRDFTAFKISFIAEDPVLAQRVTSTLTSLFISENLKTREQQSVTTTAFLNKQVEEKRVGLDEQEKKLRDLKTQFLGELPEQQDANLGILAGLQSQLQSSMAGLNRAQEQRVYLQSLLDGYLAQATLELNQLRAKRAKLLEIYTPRYSAVIKAEEEVAKAEGFVRFLQTDPFETRKAGATTAVPPAALTEQPAAAQVKSQMNANHLEIEDLSREKVRLNGEIAEYQKRLNESPAREQQLLAVTREVERLRQEYGEMQKKEQESQLATNLEKNQAGQQFRLADPPSLPGVPSSPKRLKASLAGLAGGFGLGLALAFLMEMKDRVFRSEAEVAKRFGAAIVLGVPLVLTSAEERMRNWRTSAEWVAGCALMLTVCAAEFYIYRRG